jgi:AraC-like DNA-binding protein
MRYRDKIFVSLVGVLVLSLLLNNILLFQAIRDREIALKREYIYSQARQLRKTVDYLIGKIRSDFVYLSYKDELRHLKSWYEGSDYRTKKAFLESFSPFSILSDYYDEAFLVHPDDDIMIDLKSKLISPISKSENEPRLAALEIVAESCPAAGRLYVVSGANGQAVPFLIKPISIDEEDKRMFLYVRLSDTFFKSVLDDIFLIDQSYVLITDEGGAAIKLRAKDLPLKGVDPRTFMPTGGFSGYSGIARNASGKFLVCVDSSPDYSWKYYYAIGFSSIDRSIAQVLFSYSLLSLLILALFLVVVRELSRRISLPVLGIMELFGQEDSGPGQHDELQQIETKIRDLIARNGELAATLRDSEHFERDALLESLVRGAGEVGEELEKRIVALGLDIPIGDGFSYLVYTCIDHSGPRGRAAADKGWKEAIGNIAQGPSLDDSLRGERFFDEDGRLVILAAAASSSTALDPGDLLRLGGEGDGQAFVGASGIHEGLGGLREAYKEARIALEYRSLFPGRALIRYSDVLASKKRAYFYPFEAEGRLLSAIKQRDERDTEVQFLQFRDSVRLSGLSLSSARHVYVHLVDSLMRVARDFDLSLEPDGPEGRIWDAIEEAPELSDMENSSRSFAAELLARLTSNKGSPVVALANATKEFIDRDYCDKNLSLDLIADELKYSVSHLSSVFKETFGETIKDYILRLRLARACELLSGGDKQVSRIGAEVGYENLGSFVKIFKAYIGETPKEYRLRMRRK